MELAGLWGLLPAAWDAPAMMRMAAPERRKNADLCIAMLLHVMLVAAQPEWLRQKNERTVQYNGLNRR